MGVNIGIPNIEEHSEEQFSWIAKVGDYVAKWRGVKFDKGSTY